MSRRPFAVLLVLFLFAAGCSTVTGADSPAPRATASTPRASHKTKPAPRATTTRAPQTSTSLLSGAGSVSREACGSGGRIVRFRVAVERGLQTTPETFANAVRTTLCDPRSWIGSGGVRFRYDPNGSLLIELRSPDGTERRCQQLIGLSVHRTYSCGTSREVVLNSARWFGGSPSWPGRLENYRHMLVNHETGHALGLGHQSCPRDGADAPVMMQQSKGLSSSGNTCMPNPWPLPEEWDRLT